MKKDNDVAYDAEKERRMFEKDPDFEKKHDALIDAEIEQIQME